MHRIEELPCARDGIQRIDEIGGHLAPLDRVEDRPRSVGLGDLDGAQPCRRHPALLDEAFDPALVETVHVELGLRGAIIWALVSSS